MPLGSLTEPFNPRAFPGPGAMPLTPASWAGALEGVARRERMIATLPSIHPREKIETDCARLMIAGPLPSCHIHGENLEGGAKVPHGVAWQPAERFGHAVEARLRPLRPHRPQRASSSLHIEVLMERRKRQVAPSLLKPLRKMPADLPDGHFCVESPLQKYFASPVGQIISTNSRHPTPPEGRIAIVTDAGCGCGGRGSVLRATGLQGGLRSVSDQQHADERCCCVRRSRVVLTPRRWRQVRGGQVGPTGRRQNLNPLATVAKEPGHQEHEGNVCRGKARFLRGCKSLPARVAPAGSNRSRREGNDLSVAFDGKGR